MAVPILALSSLWSVARAQEFDPMTQSTTRPTTQPVASRRSVAPAADWRFEPGDAVVLLGSPEWHALLERGRAAFLAQRQHHGARRPHLVARHLAEVEIDPDTGASSIVRGIEARAE